MKLLSALTLAACTGKELPETQDSDPQTHDSPTYDSATYDSDTYDSATYDSDSDSPVDSGDSSIDTGSPAIPAALTIEVCEDTREEDIILSNDPNVELTKLCLSAGDRALRILSLDVHGPEKDVASFILNYPVGETEETSSSVLVEDIAHFTGLEIELEADGSTELEILADTIRISGGPATSGDLVRASLALSNFKAEFTDTGEALDLSQVSVGDLEFSSSNYSTSAEQDSSSPLSLEGSEASFPSGTLLFADSNKDGLYDPESESLFVTEESWDASNQKVTVINEAGATLPEGTPIHTAKPGEGYLTEANLMHLHESNLLIDKSSTAPSGEHTASEEDTVCKWILEAEANGDVEFRSSEGEGITVDFYSDSADINTSASVEAMLIVDGSTVSTAPVSITSTSKASVNFVPNSDLEIAAGEFAIVSVQLASTTLMNVDSSENHLQSYIATGSASAGLVSPGGFTWSDGHSTIRWIGAVDNTQPGCELVY